MSDTTAQKPLAERITSTFAPAESELTKWRRTFERFAKEDVEGKKWVVSWAGADEIGT
jgi:hypothetical protein